MGNEWVDAIIVVVRSDNLYSHMCVSILPNIFLCALVMVMLQSAHYGFFPDRDGIGTASQVYVLYLLEGEKYGVKLVIGAPLTYIFNRFSLIFPPAILQKRFKKRRGISVNSDRRVKYI